MNLIIFLSLFSSNNNSLNKFLLRKNDSISVLKLWKKHSKSFVSDNIASIFFKFIIANNEFLLNYEAFFLIKISYFLIFKVNLIKTINLG